MADTIGKVGEVSYAGRLEGTINGKLHGSIEAVPHGTPIEVTWINVGPPSRGVRSGNANLARGDFGSASLRRELPLGRRHLSRKANQLTKTMHSYQSRYQNPRCTLTRTRRIIMG